MTVVCFEMQDSMSGSITKEAEAAETREVKRRYVIGQCEGFNDVVFQVEQYAPTYVNGDGAGFWWVRRKLDINGIGNKYFDVTATYQTLVPSSSQDQNNDNNGNGPEFVPGSLAWDTSGHTEHITQGIGAEASVPEDAPYFHEAINVSGDSVQGIDVVRPNLRYSETWIMSAEKAISPEYVDSVYKLTGSVNKFAFRSFDPGEALFTGAKAQWKGDQPYVAVTFDFDCRPNGTFRAGDMTGIDKKGWEHVWVRYEAESESGTLIRKPVAVYKNAVYEEKDWALLGIGAVTIGDAKTERIRKERDVGAAVAAFFN